MQFQPGDRVVCTAKSSKLHGIHGTVESIDNRDGIAELAYVVVAFDDEPNLTPAMLPFDLAAETSR